MTKAQQRLIDILRRDLGDCADPAEVIGALYTLRALDDVLARRAVVQVEFADRYAMDERRPVKVIMDEVGEEYGISLSRVWQIINR